MWLAVGSPAVDSLVEVAERLLRLVVRRPRFIFEILIVGRIIGVTAVRSFEFADGVPGEGQPAAAFFRLEGTYQTLVDADVDGYALRGVLVLNLLGVGAKFVRYPEVGAVLTW
jgi:hypothetical protein